MNEKLSLTREEMETCILFNAADRNYCHVFSNDSVWQRKLERAGAVVTKELSSGGKEYRLEAKQVSIRKLSQGRKMTEEQRNAARERLRKAREKQKKTTILKEQEIFLSPTPTHKPIHITKTR